MKSHLTIARTELLHPNAIPMFTAFVNDAEAALNITLLLVQGLRTFAQQQAIYNQGRTTPGQVVTKAKPGESYHNYGLAADYVPYSVDGLTLDWEYDFSELVPFAAKYGITWGGVFPAPDRDHFENKLGYNWRQLLSMYQAKNFIKGTIYLNI